MLVSPAEPKPFHALGKVDLATERYGSDFLIPSTTYGLVGVQRKTIEDLIASLNNSVRFAKEMGQMTSLGQGVLLLEGSPQWTNDGKLVSRSKFTQAQMYGLLWSVQSRGLWVASTASLAESIAWLLLFPKWLAKTKHRSLLDRGKAGAKALWGTADNRDWGIWLLQGFEGIGYETAAAIYDHFKGVPLQWTVTMNELVQVKGVGKGRAERLLKALGGTSSSAASLPPPNPISKGATVVSPSPLPVQYIDVASLTTALTNPS